MADTTTELEVLDQIVDVLGGTSGQYETVVPTLQQILALLGGGGGGSGSGYNPALSVGRADALTGADETAQWATRESTGSGSATVRSVQGATEVQDNKLVPVQIAGIQSKDAQGGELDAIEWTAQTLRAAGSVRDELTADKLVTRVGQCVIDGVNVRATSIAAPSGSNTTYRCAVPLPFGSVTITSNYYSAFNASHTFEFNINTLNAHIWANGNAMLYQYDGPTLLCCLDGVTTIAEANAWFAAHPVTLTYPVTVVAQPISPALPMTYKVQQGGSESIIVPDGEVSAAPVLTIAEGESAAELVMGALACIAAPDGPVATSNHAINTYLTMGGKLYKVTSAIAVGETITPNTNVSETTVMAELVARTA